MTILKYPRTSHLEGSRLQPGDEDLDSVPLTTLDGEHLVVEEKLDGANSGVSFSSDGDLRLQSRGHFLIGGYRERHFALLKTWANAHRAALWELLGTSYVAYGEWLYAKHTVFYDQLPHYFMEFDVFDRESRAFLSAPRRQALFAGSPVVSVPVVWAGPTPNLQALRDLVRGSLYKSPAWRERLAKVASDANVEPERARRETDPEDTMEGLYIKSEADGRVVGRYKYVRASFLTSVVESESHWLDRPIVPNQLAPGVDLFEQVATAPGDGGQAT